LTRRSETEGEGGEEGKEDDDDAPQYEPLIGEWQQA